MLTSRPTHGGGAPFGIDLEAGVAKITVRRPAAPAVATAPAAPEADAAAAPSEAGSQPADEDERGATPA